MSRRGIIDVLSTCGRQQTIAGVIRVLLDWADGLVVVKISTLRLVFDGRDIAHRVVGIDQLLEMILVLMEGQELLYAKVIRVVKVPSQGIVAKIDLQQLPLGIVGLPFDDGVALIISFYLQTIHIATFAVGGRDGRAIGQGGQGRAA